MARRGRPTSVVTLNADERQTLERWGRRPTSAQALALRCHIVLAAANGEANGEIAASLAKKTTLDKVSTSFGAASKFASPGGNSINSILLTPQAITKDNLQVVLDA